METNSSTIGEEPKEKGIKEIHHYHYKDRQFNGGTWLFGLLFITIGFLYLAKNLGLFDIDINLWKFWPILIIVAGLSMIKGRGMLSFLVAAIVALAVIGLIGMALFFDAYGQRAYVPEGIGSNTQMELY